MKTTWTLFIDDEREPTKDLENVQIARDCVQAIYLTKIFGVPSVISFDHDLGSDNSGNINETSMFFLHWLIEQHLDNRLSLFQVQRVIVHSRNTEGAKNIAGLWNSFAKNIGHDVVAELIPRQLLVE